MNDFAGLNYYVGIALIVFMVLAAMLLAGIDWTPPDV